MIYTVQKLEDEFLENAYRQAMSELNEFYERKWTYGLPRIFIVQDRRTINSLRGKETNSWERSWNEGSKNNFILDNEMMEQESCHKKLSDEEYATSVKHELSHSFFLKISTGKTKPLWLCEGVSIYTSGQTKLWKKPAKLHTFLEYYDDSENVTGVYTESGFAVELLVENFGKHKLLDLIRSLATADTQEKFNISFKDIYGFDPTYDEFAKLYENQNN